MVTARREKKNSCRFQYSILNWRQKKNSLSNNKQPGGGGGGSGRGGNTNAY